jgi:hypothetical protein
MSGDDIIGLLIADDPNIEYADHLILKHPYRIVGSASGKVVSYQLLPLPTNLDDPRIFVSARAIAYHMTLDTEITEAWSDYVASHSLWLEFRAQTIEEQRSARQALAEMRRGSTSVH